MINFEDINKQLVKINKLTCTMCRKCGGFCEHHEICWFFPGEVDFLAKKLKISEIIFERKFITKLKYKNRIIQILKLAACPFLKKASVF